MKILVIDGQGGKMGAALTEQILKSVPQAELVAVGTNSMATAAMLRAGATAAATGENPVVVNSAWADVIVGPIGISVVGVQEKPLAEYVREAVQRLLPPKREAEGKGNNT